MISLPDMQTKLQDQYDVIVVGAGVGGLTAGLYLAKAGAKVLILERHWVVGGCSSSFRHKGFYFDAAAHYLSSCREDGQIGKLLRDHDLADRIVLTRPDPSDVVVIPPFSMEVRPGFEKFVSHLQELFPLEKDGIRNLFSFVWNTDAMTLYVRLKGLTFDKVLNEYLSDYRLKSLLGVLLGNIGVPASRASALAAVFMFREFVLDGGYYPIGGMQRFCDLLAERFQEYGGDICLATPVSQILIRNGRVSGVVIDKLKNRALVPSREIQSSQVIANCDPIQLTEQLIAPQDRAHLKTNGLRNRVASISAFMMHIGTRESIKDRCKHKAFIWYHPDWDVDGCYRGWMDNEVNFNDSFLFCGFPSFHDPSLAPPGKDSVHIIIGAPYKTPEFWETNKLRMAESAIARAERFIPGLSKLTEFQLIATPQTLQRFTSNYQGAMYGWASIPEQVAEHRFGDSVGIDGLYLTGHWSGPPAGQGGIPMVAYAGRTIAQKMLRVSSRRRVESADIQLR